jgi:hypothetical protein
MKGWITVHLLCKTEESIEFDRLSIKVDDSLLKFNPYKVQISQIGSVGLCVDTGGSFLNICGQQAETKESPLEIFKLIEEQQECDHLLIAVSDSLGNVHAKCSKCGFRP